MLPTSEVYVPVKAYKNLLPISKTKYNELQSLSRKRIIRTGMCTPHTSMVMSDFVSPWRITATDRQQDAVMNNIVYSVCRCIRATISNRELNRLCFAFLKLKEADTDEHYVVA